MIPKRIQDKLRALSQRRRKREQHLRGELGKFKALAEDYQREANDYRRRLESIVQGRVMPNDTKRDALMLVVEVDRRWAYQYPRMWQDAVRQLQEQLRKALGK